MRKTQSSPNISGLSTTHRRVTAINALPYGSSPPTVYQSPLLEHVESLVPATLFQFAQCTELYGTPKDILEAPPLNSEDTFKTTMACMLTPDEPPERPLESLRETLNPRIRFENMAYLNERFERLFMSIRRSRQLQRRRMTI